MECSVLFVSQARVFVTVPIAWVNCPAQGRNLSFLSVKQGSCVTVPIAWLNCPTQMPWSAVRFCRSSKMQHGATAAAAMGFKTQGCVTVSIVWLKCPAQEAGEVGALCNVCSIAHKHNRYSAIRAHAFVHAHVCQHAHLLLVGHSMHKNLEKRNRQQQREEKPLASN